MDKEGDMLVVHHGYAVPRFDSEAVKIEAGSIPVEQICAQGKIDQLSSHLLVLLKCTGYIV
jgi:hypothetical protein